MTRNKLARAANWRAGIIAAAFCMVGSPSPTIASQVEDTIITAVGVGPYYDNNCQYTCMFIQLQTAPVGSSCLMDSGWHYVINISTPEGRVTAAAVLAAKAGRELVHIVGVNSCVFNGRVEVLDRFIAK